MQLTLNVSIQPTTVMGSTKSLVTTTTASNAQHAKLVPNQTSSELSALPLLNNQLDQDALVTNLLTIRINANHAQLVNLVTMTEVDAILTT
jgi:hypothetical protein